MSKPTVAHQRSSAVDCLKARPPMPHHPPEPLSPCYTRATRTCTNFPRCHSPASGTSTRAWPGCSQGGIIVSATPRAASLESCVPARASEGERHSAQRRRAMRAPLPPPRATRATSVCGECRPPPSIGRWRFTSHRAACRVSVAVVSCPGRSGVNAARPGHSEQGVGLSPPLCSGSHTEPRRRGARVSPHQRSRGAHSVRRQRSSEVKVRAQGRGARDAQHP